MPEPEMKAATPCCQIGVTLEAAIVINLLMLALRGMVRITCNAAAVLIVPSLTTKVSNF